MLAAARGENYRIAYGGVGQMQLASDVALQFIACADQASEGAHVFNMGGEMVSMQQVVDLIQAVVPNVQITFEPTQLPFPRGFDDSALRQHAPTVYETPVAQGIARTVEQFRDLIARSLV
jgi:nucleoside-diphosphate-sugar epimerase